MIVALALEEGEKCSTCGLTDREFLDNPDAYQALQTVCPWCAMRDTARDSKDTDTKLPGATLRLVPAFVAERLANMKSVRPMSRRERARTP